MVFPRVQYLVLCYYIFFIDYNDLPIYNSVLIKYADDVKLAFAFERNPTTQSQDNKSTTTRIYSKISTPLFNGLVITPNTEH